MTGRARAEGVPEAGSAVVERRVRRGRLLRGFRFRVVPGENAATRLGGLDEVFHDSPVDGVLHVVANGYATGRRPAGTTGAAQVVAGGAARRGAGGLDGHRAPHRLAWPYAASGRRGWSSWSPRSTSSTSPWRTSCGATHPRSGTAFGNRLDELRALAGAAKLSIDVLPVCSHLEEGSSVSRSQRDAYLAALEARMAQLSGPRLSAPVLGAARVAGARAVCQRGYAEHLHPVVPVRRSGHRRRARRRGGRSCPSCCGSGPSLVRQPSTTAAGVR